MPDFPAQRSAEWRQQRCGKVTASRVAEVIGRLKGGGWAAPRAKYMEQLVAERLTGRPQDMRQVRSMTERADLEPEARAAYRFYTGNKVDEVGFTDHPTIANAGASDDGRVGDDGMIEIKCLDAATHVKLWQGDDTPILTYMPQMVFGLACNERHWCDFVAYCPIMPEELKLFVRRIDRDNDVIAAIETQVLEFIAEIDGKVAELLAIARRQ